MNKTLLYIKKEDINSICAKDVKRSTYIYHKEVKGFLGIGKKKAGYVDTQNLYNKNRYTLTEILKPNEEEYKCPYISIAGIIYKKAYIILDLEGCDGYKYIYYDSFKEVLQVLEDFRKEGILDNMINILK